MTYLPQVIEFDIWIAIKLNCFDCWKLIFLDLIHEISWSAVSISNFLDFWIEKFVFCPFDCTLEFFPIFQSFGLSILLQTSTAILVPPNFGVFSNIYNFGIFKPDSFCTTSESLDDMFKIIFFMNVVCIKTFDGLN